MRSSGRTPICACAARRRSAIRKSCSRPLGFCGCSGDGAGFRGADGVAQESAQDEESDGEGREAGEGAGAGSGPGSWPDPRSPFDAAELPKRRRRPNPRSPLRQPGKAHAAATPKDPFIYDETWDEAERLAGWRAGMAQSRQLAAAPRRASPGARLASRRAGPAPGLARAAASRPLSAPPRPHQSASFELQPRPPPPAADTAAAGLPSNTSTRSSRSSKPARVKVSRSTTG